LTISINCKDCSLPVSLPLDGSRLTFRMTQPFSTYYIPTFQNNFQKQLSYLSSLLMTGNFPGFFILFL